MDRAGTLPDPITQGESKICLLTYVLQYEDLLSDRSTSHLILAASPQLSLGRADEFGGHGLRSADRMELDDAWASGHHADILRHGSQALLVDRGSRNGTYVNGTRITEHVLADGDLIEIGHTLFCFREIDATLMSRFGQENGAAQIGPTQTRCPEVLALVHDLHRIAPTREAVLILGETGTGKEVVAAAVHQLSQRSGAFRAVDCGAIPENLFESTLFGHRRGAFTGANEHHTGEIVRAHRGTLFLDEVANMSLASQAKLLRVLEDGQVTPVGGTAKEAVDVRWVAATNRDLLREEATFRSDVLRRLAAYVARLPPLRKRREDLGTLSAFLLRQAGIEKASITAAAGRRFFSNAFPGNIRQLRTSLRSAAALAGDRPIDVQHFPGLEEAPRLLTTEPQVPPASAPAAADESSARERGTTPNEQELRSALRSTNGNVVHAAQLLKTHPRQLYRWLARFKLALDDFRH